LFPIKKFESPGFMTHVRGEGHVRQELDWARDAVKEDDNLRAS